MRSQAWLKQRRIDMLCGYAGFGYAVASLSWMCELALPGIGPL